MANSKKCNGCGETKSITKFHRYHKSKDGYQHWCSDCRNSYQYADTDAKLYEIINPIGERYIGVTKATLNKRFSRYRWNIKNNKKCPPLLLKSFLNHGLDNHKMNLIKNLGNISRTEMFRIEREWLKQYQPELNVNGK